MQELRSPVSAGEHVQVRGEPWIVARIDAFPRCLAVTLRGTGEHNLGRVLSVLSPFDRVRRTVERRRLVRATRANVLRAAAAAVVRAQGWCDPWTAAAARIELLPWQLEPARAAVAGAMRLLLADGVGLGKTIQAALVATELAARGLVSRTLILTPASLGRQWAGELADRFNLRPAVFDRETLARLAAELPRDVNPWATANVIVSSIDLVKRPESRVAVDAARFDLLIVDEAHHLTPGSDRGAVVADLAARIPWIVLATATPHGGDERAYAFVRDLGTSGADELRVFRRTAGAIGRLTSRRMRWRAVEPTPRERELLAATLAYARTIWREQAAGERSQLVAAVVARRAVSSAHAVHRTLARRLTLLGGGAVAAPAQRALPWDEGDHDDEVEADELLGQPGLETRSREVAWLARLVTLATDAAADGSKAQTIERLLSRTREPALIFTEYRDTIDHLLPFIERAGPVAVLHGGLAAAARARALHAFASGRARTLLATDVAGEGLNLQQRCRLVINVEVPWSPVRLEQRIGRVDRLGQTRPVHALQLHVAGTYEDHVRARLVGRLARARTLHTPLSGASPTATRGEPALPERDPLHPLAADERATAAAIIGHETSFTHTTLGPTTGHPIAANWDLDRLARTRRLITALSTARGPGRPAARRRSRATVRPGHAALFTPVSARAPLDGLLLLFELTLVDARGRLATRTVAPLAIAGVTREHLRRARCRETLQHLCQAPAVRRVLDELLAVRGREAERAIRMASERIERRLLALIDRLAARNDAPLVQASLFDRRVEQQAHARAASVAAWRTQLLDGVDAARALRDLRVRRPRLIAAWPLHGSTVRDA